MVLLFVLLGVGCTPQCEKNAFEPSKPIVTPTPEFKIEDLKRGDGPELQAGDLVEIHYQGWLYDSSSSDKKGSLVVNTYPLGKPQTIRFGADDLIEGWQVGLLGLRKGGKRRLFIPSAMAYGNIAAGTQIPAGAHLVYEIEIISLTPGVVKLPLKDDDH